MPAAANNHSPASPSRCEAPHSVLYPPHFVVPGSKRSIKLIGKMCTVRLLTMKSNSNSNNSNLIFIEP